MKKFDACGLWGNWPFRLIPNHTVADLKAMHQRYGITGGCVASLESVFYNDPMESEERLAAELAGTEYRQVITVNPTLPAFDEMIDEAVERFDVAAVKIVPGYHGYRLTDDCMETLHKVLVKHHLPLYVVRRIEDVRLNYLVLPREPDNEEFTALAKAMPDVKLLFCGFSGWEMLPFAPLCKECPNVYFEMSLFKNGVGWMPYGLEQFPADRLLFGSSYPFYVMRTQVMNVEETGLSEEIQKKLYSENAEAFFAK